MELEIIKEKDNSLFKRKEVQAKLETDVTPSESEIVKNIAEKFSSQPENIKIKGIHGTFGKKEFTVTANIYESPEEKKAIESKKKKGAQAEEKPAESEKPAETPKEETPAQENKVEGKAE